MCFPEGSSTSCAGTRQAWSDRSGDVGADAAATGRYSSGANKWRHFILHNGKERWRRIRDWSRNKLFDGVEQTVQLVTLWVVNLSVSFTLFAIPVLFLAFLSVLSPYRDIQACVCVAMALGLVLLASGWLDIPGGHTVRIGVYKLLKRIETTSIEAQADDTLSTSTLIGPASQSLTNHSPAQTTELADWMASALTASLKQQARADFSVDLDEEDVTRFLTATIQNRFLSAPTTDAKAEEDDVQQGNVKTRNVRSVKHRSGHNTRQV